MVGSQINLMLSWLTVSERMLYAWQTDVNLGMEDTPKVMTIKVPFGVGIAGTAAEKGVVVNVADAYTDPRFNRVGRIHFHVHRLTRREENR